MINNDFGKLYDLAAPKRQKYILRKHGFVRAVEGQRIWRLVL